MQLNTGFRQISRNELQGKLNTMASDLKSKGTIDDPVSKKVGWMPADVYSFESKIVDYSGDTLDGMRQSAQAKVDQAREAKGSDTKGWAASVGLIAAGVLATPLVGALGCGLLAGVGAVCGAAHLWNLSQHSKQEAAAQGAVEGLDKWQNAFQQVETTAKTGFTETSQGYLYSPQKG